ncbi:MAG: ATP-binding cassette domain-containing protein, partial [Planctomycetota bacterium]
MSRESGSAAVRAAPAVEIEGLGVRYGGRTVLEGVTLQVPAHRITALVGPSGCGKTSLLMALNRLTDLLPGCAVTGRIRVGGRDTLGASVDVAALRRRVGMVFQRPVPFPFSIRHNL